MFKNEDDFEKKVSRLNIDTKPNPAHRQNLHRQMLSAFSETSEQPESQVTVFQNIRRTIMKSPVTKLATAAVVVIAVIIGVHQFKLSVSPESAPLDIKLPRPMFEGTPENIQGVVNLEKPLGRPRPPFYAPAGTKNVAFGKPVAGTDQEPIIGEIEMVTDGDKEAADGSYVELGPLLQHVTIDLEADYDIYAVLVWHYHKEGRVYIDVVVQVADDPDFITNVRTVFNNDIDNSSGLGIGKDMHYVETHEGKLIDARGVRARYVRLYSNGSSSNDLNHYIEVEVFGKPAK